MKKTILFTLLQAFIGLSTASAQVGIGTTTPHASAALEVEATDKGFLPPRMSTSNRNNINGPTAGLVIYNTTSNTLQFSDGTDWVDLADNSTTAVSGTEPTTGTGDVGIGTTSPNVNAVLDIVSTTKGFLPPQMSEAQRGNITSSAVGLTIYNTDNGCLETYNGASWISLCSVSPLTANSCDPANPTAVVEVNAGGHTWMDRNLGASRAATSSTDHIAYGSLYQWGRSSDGHECINWISSTASDGAEQSNESSSQSTSPNPGSTFIVGFNNWYNGTNPDDLWKPDLTGVNNPCPAGYRVPSETELTALGITNASTAYSSIGLPMAGGHSGSNGSLGDVGTSGRYWSSTVSSSSSRGLGFNSSDAQMGTANRAFGISVRCLKD